MEDLVKLSTLQARLRNYLLEQVEVLMNYRNWILVGSSGEAGVEKMLLECLQEGLAKQMMRSNQRAFWVL